MPEKRPFFEVHADDKHEPVTGEWLSKTYGATEHFNATDEESPGMWHIYDGDGTARLSFSVRSDGIVSCHLEDMTVAWPHDIHAKEQVYLLVAAVFC